MVAFNGVIGYAKGEKKRKQRITSWMNSIKYTQQTSRNISILYVSVFKEKIKDINWDEFFLIRPQPEHLDDFDWKFELAKLQENLHELVDRCIYVILNKIDISFINASTTLTTIISIIAQKISLNSEGFSLIFSDDSKNKLPAVMRRYATTIAHSQYKSLKICSWNAILKIATACPDVSGNSLLEYVCCQDILEAILIQFIPGKTRNPFASRALRLFSVLLCHFDGSIHLLLQFALFEDQKILMGFSEEFRHYVAQMNSNFIERHGNCLADQSVVEFLSNKLSDLFSSTGNEVRVDILDLVYLYLFHSTITTNKNLLAAVFAIPPHAHEHHSNTPPSSIISLFITFCSFALLDMKSDTARLRAKLCFLTLLRLTDDSYALNEMHHTGRSEPIPIFRPDLLHRKAALDLNPQPTTSASTLLDLQTEFIMANLKLSVPLEFFDFSLGIIHRILAFGKEKEKRLDKWKPLFSALINLLKFLIINEQKLPFVDPLVLRLVMLVNFFITYGDLFLPDGDAYENVYYEIIRQQTIFLKLKTTLASSPKNDVTEKTQMHLNNILNIIETVQPTLDRFDDYPSEEEVFTVIQDSFDHLALRVFPTLTMVDRYEASIHQRTFFEILSVKIAGRVREVVDDEVLDYSKFLQELSQSK
ncbi:unnamed protein product, partial [Mesorhabditis belari]|uniref:Armadillo-like helical domain-containing protein n=1 Tax=Mesorhabditis belari TaxID=2138241 RepID=A0AAF3FB15_9BILA